MAKVNLATFYKILKHFVFHVGFNIYPQDQSNHQQLLTLETEKARTYFKMKLLNSVLKLQIFPS